MNARTLGDIERPPRKRYVSAKPAPSRRSCEWCGRFHPMVWSAKFNDPKYHCQLTYEHRQALTEFARSKGVAWKVELRRMAEYAFTPILREAYDVMGHAGLYRVRVDRYLR